MGGNEGSFRDRAFDGLVGRDAAVQTLLASVAAERPLVVVGEAGIGKTAVVRAALVASGRRWFEGGGFSTLDWLPYLPLRRALGRDLDGDATGVTEAVEAGVGPDVLFLDDVQWFDRETLAVLDLLVGRVALVLALREGDDEADHRLRRLDALGVERLRLEPLDDAAARSMVVGLRPELERSTVDRLVEEAGGIPLVLEQLAAAGSVSVSAALGLLDRAAALGPDARRIVEQLAVADRPLRADRLDPGLDEACSSGLVTERDGLAAIRHAVLAASIRDGIDPAEVVGLHAELAALVDDPAEAARHLLEAGDPGTALARALAALDDADGPRDRATLLVIAAEASEPGDTSRRRLEAARALDALADWHGVIAILPGAPGAATATPTAALDRDPDPSSVEIRVECDALRAHAEYSIGRPDAARALLEDAARLPVDPRGAAAARLAWERAAFMVNVDGAVGEGIGFLDGQLAARDGDGAADHMLEGLRDSLALLAGVPIDTMRIQAALDEALASRAYARATDLARVMNVALLMWRGSAGARQFLAEQAPRFEAGGASDAALEFLAEAVQVDVEDGRFVDAVMTADELAERPVPRRVAQMAAIFRCSALGVLGRLDDADDGLRAIEGTVTGDWFGRGEWLAIRAQVALWNGRPDRAAELVEEALAVPTPLVGGHILPRLTAAWAAFELGGPFGSSASPIRSLAGAEAEFDALRDLAAGDSETAAARFADAASLWEDYNAVRAMTCWWAEAEALRRAGAPGAIDRLRAVLERSEAAGFQPMAARARRSLRLAGVRIATRRGSRRVGVTQLTPRERELVDLVGRGLTNLEIARRMGLGRPTVVRILSNAMAKLGATSRAQAVVRAADRVPDRRGRSRAIAEPEPAEPSLSPNAVELLALLADGLTLGEAAARLGLSRRTADRRLAVARHALGTDRTTEAIARARRTGWLGPAAGRSS